METQLRTRARFPDLGAGDGHYESFYLKASHPTERIALWIRYTVHKRPGDEPQRLALVRAVRARQQTARGPSSRLSPGRHPGGDDYIRIGDAQFSDGEVDGQRGGGGEQARPGT